MAVDATIYNAKDARLQGRVPDTSDAAIAARGRADLAQLTARVAECEAQERTLAERWQRAAAANDAHTDAHHRRYVNCSRHLDIIRAMHNEATRIVCGVALD
jgi:hypothetical protein